MGELRSCFLSSLLVISSGVASCMLLFSFIFLTPSIALSPSLRVPIGFWSGLSRYVMEFQIGTPPTTIKLLVDSAETVIKVPCGQDLILRGDSYLNFTNSTSYTKYPCTALECPTHSNWYCGTANALHTTPQCQYALGQVHGGYAYETCSMPNSTYSLYDKATRPLLIGKFVIVCIFTSYAPSTTSVPGTVALGRDQFSLNKQLSKPPYDVDDVFTYCLVEYKRFTPNLKTSEVVFGAASADYRREGMVTIPLLADSNQYVVQLSKLRIGSYLPIIIPRSTPNGRTKTLFNTGTFLTQFPASVYPSVLKTFKKFISPADIVFSRYYPNLLCIHVENFPNLSFPGSVALVFDGYVELELRVENFMFLAGDNQACLAMDQSPAGPMQNFTILGSAIQQNFRIIINNAGNEMSIGYENC